MQGIDSDLIRGHIDTIILKVLFEGDRYGYEICKEVEEKSRGTYELKQPTLYSCLKRLEDKGLISSYWEESDIGGKRHYYKLTDEGRQTFQENYDEWTRSREIIDNLISNPFVKKQYELGSAMQTKQENSVSDEEFQKAIKEAYNKGLDEGKKSAPLQTAVKENAPSQSLTDSILLSSHIEDDDEIIPWGNPKEEHIASEEHAVDSNVWHDEDNAVVNTTANGEPIEAIPNTLSEENNFYDDEELPFDEEVSKAQASFFESGYDGENNENTNVEVHDDLDKPIYIEHNEETAISYDEKPMLDAPEEKPEENVPFVFDIDGYRLKSNESYFESNEISDPQSDYIAPEVKIDGLKDETPVEEEAKESPLVEPETVAPVYHDFGTSELLKKHEDEIWVDDSNLDEDSIYLNPDAVKEEPADAQLTLFDDEVEKEQETPYEEDYTKPSEETFSPSSESEDLFEVEDTSSGNATFMDFYKTTENYDNLEPGYTDEESKEKLSSLMNYSASEKPKDDVALQKVMSYDELKSEFEKEGLVVKEHKRHLKEAKATRSYIESNKLNLVTSWTSFGIVTFLLTLAYFISSSYRASYNSALGFASDGTYKYFLIGMAVIAIVPIIYTILFIINPYKKKPARYVFRLNMLFAILLTIQLFIIIYCVNLQLGFYSFSQPTYNHLLWIVPCVMSLYPILDAILHNIYFRSKNFHV